MLSGRPDNVPYRTIGKDDSSKHPPIKTSLSMPTPSVTSDSNDKYTTYAMGYGDLINKR